MCVQLMRWNSASCKIIDPRCRLIVIRAIYQWFLMLPNIERDTNKKLPGLKKKSFFFILPGKEKTKYMNHWIQNCGVYL